MRRSALWVVEEAQRDPARVEFGVDLRVVRHGGVFGTDRVGRGGVAGIEHLARQHAPLRPPFIRIDEHGGVARRAPHQRRRLGDLVGSAKLLDFREDEAGIGLESGGHGGDGLVGLDVRDHRRARLGQREDVGPGDEGRTKGGDHLFLVEQAVGAVLVISLGEVGAEIGLQPRFEGRRQLVLAKQRPRQFGAVGRSPVVLEGFRQGQLAARRLRSALGEEAFDRFGILYGEQARLDLATEPCRSRPSGMLAREGLETPEADLLRDVVEGGPFKCGPHQRVGDLPGRRVPDGKIVGVISGNRLHDARRLVTEPANALVGDGDGIGLFEGGGVLRGQRFVEHGPGTIGRDIRGRRKRGDRRVRLAARPVKAAHGRHEVAPGAADALSHIGEEMHPVRQPRVADAGRQKGRDAKRRRSKQKEAAAFTDHARLSKDPRARRCADLVRRPDGSRELERRWLTNLLQSIRPTADTFAFGR